MSDSFEADFNPSVTSPVEVGVLVDSSHEDFGVEISDSTFDRYCQTHSETKAMGNVNTSFGVCCHYVTTRMRRGVMESEIELSTQSVLTCHETDNDDFSLGHTKLVCSPSSLQAKILPTVVVQEMNVL
jgi:hypothetical protein